MKNAFSYNGQVEQLPYPANISSSFSFSSVQPSILSQVTISVKAKIGSVIMLNWGNGTTVNLLATGHEETFVSNYVTNNTTYTITFSGDLFGLTKISIQNNSTVSININTLKTSNVGVVNLTLNSLATCTGSLNNLPPSLSFLKLSSIGNSITGSTNKLPRFLSSIFLSGFSLITGTLDSLPVNLIELTLTNCSQISGTVDNFSNDLRVLILSNLSTTITGLLENLPNRQLNALTLENLGTGIGGSIDSLVNTEAFQAAGINYLNISATSDTNAFTGSINTLIANNPVMYDMILVNLGNNITGDLDNLKFNYMTLSSYSTITIKGCGANINYNNGVLPAFARVSMTLHCGLTTTEVDNFLINFNATCLNGNFNLLDLAGNNEGRSSASDLACAAIYAPTKYFNLVTNDPVGYVNSDAIIGLTATAGVATPQIALNYARGYKMPFVDWGDGSIDYVNTHVNKPMTHIYATSGAKSITIGNMKSLTVLDTLSTITGLTGNINQFSVCDKIIRFKLQGSSSLMTGELSSLAKASLVFFLVDRAGTSMTCNLDNFSVATSLAILYLFNNGAGLVTGSIKSIPTSVTTLTVASSGTNFNIATGPHPAWAGATIILTNAHPAADTDAFLNSWATTAGVGTKTVTITSTRTAASNAAVTTLNGKGKTII